MTHQACIEQAAQRRLEGLGIGSRSAQPSKRHQLSGSDGLTMKHFFAPR